MTFKSVFVRINRKSIRGDKVSELYDSICLTSVEATVLSMMGIDLPDGIAPPNRIVLEKFSDVRADRAVLYNPDAVALWIFQKYTELFADAYSVSDLAVPLLSVMPSVTPVCFASMYTGVLPEVHGIRRYEKPVLRQRTLFDVLIENGKKPAIVSTSGDSISKIFLERDMDYFIYDTIDEVNARAHELIRRDIYDVIVIYNGNYDSRMHKTGPESEDSLNQLRRNIADYRAFAEDIRSFLGEHTTFFGFMPDHGCHEIDGDCGGHGLDMEEDMNIIHFYGLNRGTSDDT